MSVNWPNNVVIEKSAVGGYQLVWYHLNGSRSCINVEPAEEGGVVDYQTPDGKKWRLRK